MKKIRYEFKNGKEKLNESKKARLQFLEELREYKDGILIVSSWRKQAKSNEIVRTDKKYINIHEIYIVGLFEGLEYSIEKDVLHLHCRHLSSDFEYDNYYRLRR